MVQTSDQIQDLTTSKDGTERVARLQPRSHFFIEGGSQSGDFTQSTAESFGVINENQFRATASLSFSGNKQIYALCIGTVFLQPSTDAAKVNLILRPFKQPITGLSIKYIVYRGLKKADFIAGNVLAGSEDSGTGFVKYLWKQFNKFYEAGSAPSFFANFIGFPTDATQLAAQDAIHLIDKYFFKVAQPIDANTENPVTAYELPIIPRGLHLGEATNSIGIDIVLNKGDYHIENDTHPFQLNLAFARANATIIDISSETDIFRKKLLRETATQFIDIAAFYGLHANGAGKLFVDAIETPLTTKEDIYARLQNFATKNNFYLYIQSNRQRSYNFYKNYNYSAESTNNLKIGTTIDTTAETIFGTNNWPVHIINQPQDAATANNTIVLQLTTDNNIEAALFSQIGVLSSAHEENFVRNDNLLQQPDDASTIDTNYTKPIVLITPAIADKTIAAFAQLIYEGKVVVIPDFVPLPQAGNSPQEAQINFLKDIDDVFGLLQEKSFFAVANSPSPTIVNETLQIINFVNATGAVDIGAIKHQRIEDRLQTVDENTYLSRVTYETLLHSINNNESRYFKTTSSAIDNTTSNNQQIILYQPKTPYHFKTKLFTDKNNIVTGLVLQIREDNLPSKKILGITKGEFTQLKTAITDHQIQNPKIFFKTQLYNNSDFFISPESIRYQLYTLHIVGENNLGELKLYNIDTIQVYTLDQYIFFSEAYTEFIPEIGEDEFDLLRTDLILDE